MAAALCGSAEAQFINNGKVVNRKGYPISGATVRGKGLMSSTTTNMDGSFSFETTLPIKHIEASYMGRKKTQKRTDYTVIKMGDGGSIGSSDEHPWFVNGQLGSDVERDGVGGGLMAGYAKNWGGYLNIIIGDDANLITAGIIRKIYKGVNFYIGGGYVSLQKEESYYYYYGSYVETYDDDAFCADAGFLFKIGRITANIGFATEFDDIYALRVGVGYSF